jgi:hypothetical protein
MHSLRQFDGGAIDTVLRFTATISACPSMIGFVTARRREPIRFDE